MPRRDSLVLFVHGAHHAGWCWLLVMDDGVVRLPPAAGEFLFHRTSTTLARLALARLRPMRSEVPSEPLADPAWTTVPSSYVVCGDDRAVQPEAQRERAALVGTAAELDSDHSPYLSRVPELAGVIADRHREMPAAA